MTAFRIIPTATELPDEWNKIAENYFQQTPFLIHAEKYNPCKQRYYLSFENDKLLAAAIVYTLQLDLLTYLRIKSPIKMHIIGIPCSVSSPGIFGDRLSVEQLKTHIYSVEKGFLLALNLKEKPSNTYFASGKTLPTLVLENHFSGWNNYIDSLRAPYRRRLKQLSSTNANLHFEEKIGADFTEEMYQQYLNVYQKSKDKLEKLSFDFFKYLPIDFKLTTCSMNKKTVGWNIALSDNKTYYFFLGGIDYPQNEVHQTYLRLMVRLVKKGIENQSAAIDLGQTAEVPKMRMGGTPVPRYMEARHSYRLLNWLLKKFGGALEYKRNLENTQAFKTEEV